MAEGEAAKAIDEARRQRRDDEKLLRRAEKVLTEIKVAQGLANEHASVLAALRIRQVLIMLKSPEKPAPRNGDQKTKSAPQPGSRGFYRPTSRNTPLLRSTRAMSTVKCTVAPPQRR